MFDQNYILSISKLQVQAKEGLQGLYNIESRWKELEKKTVSPSFVQGYEWLESYLESKGLSPDNLWFFIVSNEIEDVIILPLIYVTDRVYGLPVRIWQIFWPNDMGINDILLAKHITTENFFDEFVAYLRCNSKYPFDYILMKNAADHSGVTTLIQADRKVNYLRIFDHESKYIEIKDTYDKTTERLSGKYKRNLRRKYKKLEQSGEVIFTNALDSDLDDAFNDFLKVESSGWKGTSGVGTAIILNPRMLDFYTKLKDKNALTGNCFIQLFKVNEVSIAAQFCLIYKNCINLLKIGFDENYSNISPGALILNETLKYFSGNPNFNKLSFVTGAEWNDAWMPKSENVYSIYIFNDTIRGFLFFVMYRLKNKIKRKYFNKTNRR